KPIGARALDAVPRPAAAAVYFAALDREVHLVAAGIAADQLNLGAEQILQQPREIVGLGARALAGERERLCHRVRPGPDPARVPGGAQARARRDAAEPSELAGVELRLADERLERRAAGDRADHAAVLGSHAVEIHRGLEAARTGHVLRDDRRMAGNV